MLEFLKYVFLLSWFNKKFFIIKIFIIIFFFEKILRFIVLLASSSGMTRRPPIVGSAFLWGSRRVLIYGVSLLMGSCERRRRIGMAVKRTPLLTYGGDKSLQSIKKKNIYIYIYIYIFLLKILIFFCLSLILLWGEVHFEKFH